MKAAKPQPDPEVAVALALALALAAPSGLIIRARRSICRKPGGSITRRRPNCQTCAGGNRSRIRCSTA